MFWWCCKMIPFSLYLKRFLSKEILIFGVDGTEIDGSLKSIHGSFIVLDKKGASIPVQLNNVFFVREKQ